jgi:hypothetical protein
MELSDKEKIINLFYKNVKNVEINTTKSNKKHDGKEGHWLEKKMGIILNNKNAPDLYNYEMKKMSRKITFGDHSASEYLFSQSKKRPNLNILNDITDNKTLTKNQFIKIFGNKNIKKNRYSWSGSCIPTFVDVWTLNGQKLLVTENNDLHIIYSFVKDTRLIKNEFPNFLKNKPVIIAIWKSEKMRNHINSKYNQKGFFICKKEGNKFKTICFGKPFDFEFFINCIKNKTIFFDSGMHESNSRNYSHFRASHFWTLLITSEH